MAKTMIHEMLTENTIEVNVKAESWKDAVRRAGELLYRQEKIEKVYIEKMIEIVEEVGPYIVIMPGIALAHARPECGAKEIGLSLIRLAEPVCFGNEDNDPVTFVFALCAKDNSSHIDLISEMGQLFCDEKAMNRLMVCETKQKIMDVINETINV